MQRSRSLNRLPSTPARLNKLARTPGKHRDGGGLMLVVDGRGRSRWLVRIKVDKKDREFGLGSFRDVTLAEARQKAADVRKAVAEGRDPRPPNTADITQTSRLPDAVNFKQAFEQFWLDKAPTLRNANHRRNWRHSIDHHCQLICDRPVAEIASTEVHEVLRPIWRKTPEAAADVLQRMRATFESAIFHGHRTAACPTTGIERILGSIPRQSKGHPALAYDLVPAFLRDLHALPRAGLGTKLGLHFLILTAMRSEAVRKARWAEVDLGAATWVVPAENMKAKGDRRSDFQIPLLTAATAVLERAKAELAHPDCVIFPSVQGRVMSDNTMSKAMRDMGLRGVARPHGFRSTFKDWAAEMQWPDELSEAALAHVDSNKVRRAYLRTDFLDQRKKLMEAWGQHCGQSTVDRE